MSLVTFVILITAPLLRCQGFLTPSPSLWLRHCLVPPVSRSLCSRWHPLPPFRVTRLLWLAAIIPLIPLILILHVTSPIIWNICTTLSLLILIHMITPLRIMLHAIIIWIQTKTICCVIQLMSQAGLGKTPPVHIPTPGKNIYIGVSRGSPRAHLASAGGYPCGAFFPEKWTFFWGGKCVLCVFSKKWVLGHDSFILIWYDIY